ncbi:Multidomain esterase [Pontiella sulfatireligans]|uniref:Multidomain esterase n=1 Tax=Pontiella sulfatireligans TaxID=2750658 RepID=A0A6C2UNV7_9BACT|nr:Multidomain esterase [Pontiella sulfatireligans]
MASPIRIMPLGDSITRGYGAGISNESSFRKTLRQLLADDGYGIDFVGSQTSGFFADNQHEGRNGWYAGHDTATNNVLDHIADWMAATPADIVLVHLGTNDILHNDEDANEVSDIMDVIFVANPDATVVLALIINAQACRPEITTYNSNLNAMAIARIASGDDIIVVDMENGAGIDYSSGDMADGLHPSPIGYDKMATNWYPAVVQAISQQRVQPAIESLSIAGASISLQLGRLEPGSPIVVERTDSLTPPAWTNAGTFTPSAVAANWTGMLQTNWSQGFYRLATDN